MTTLQKALHFSRIAVIAAVVAGAASADTVILTENLLPGSNVNNGANRSNWYVDQPGYPSGDVFYLSNSQSTWHITGITTWSVAASPGATSQFSNVTLLGGRYAGTNPTNLTTLYSGGFNTANESTQRVWYSQDVDNPVATSFCSGCLDYVTSAGSTLFLQQHIFTVDWTVQGGQWYYLTVFGTPNDGAAWNNVYTDYGDNGSNADLSGQVRAFHPSSDGAYQLFYPNGGSSYYVYDYPRELIDMNAVIRADAPATVPEPGTVFLFATELGGILFMRRFMRRRRR